MMLQRVGDGCYESLDGRWTVYRDNYDLGWILEELCDGSWWWVCWRSSKRKAITVIEQLLKEEN